MNFKGLIKGLCFIIGVLLTAVLIMATSYEKTSNEKEPVKTTVGLNTSATAKDTIKHEPTKLKIKTTDKKGKQVIVHKQTVGGNINAIRTDKGQRKGIVESDYELKNETDVDELQKKKQEFLEKLKE